MSGLRLCLCVEEKGDAAGPTAARELGISPAQGAGACFRDPDVSARNPACAPEAGWGSRTPLKASPQPAHYLPRGRTRRSHHSEPQ